MVRFAGGATAALSGAATLPKGRPVQIDLRIFGSEGMLLLDIERERLELRRRDGKDEVIALKPGDRAPMPARSRSACSSTSASARKTNNSAPGETGMRAVEVLDAMYRSAESGRMEKV